jgi:hypothetical protein
MTITAGVLDAKQTQRALDQGQAIVDAAEVGAVRDNQFVFFAAFDGTRNDMTDVPLSKNPQDTNVAELYKQAYKAKDTNTNLGVGYYQGHGTKGSLNQSDWLPSRVTQETINTAQRAYDEFASEALNG